MKKLEERIFIPEKIDQLEKKMNELIEIVNKLLIVEKSKNNTKKNENSN